MASIDHMAGIVPVFGNELSLAMPWHDSLTPVAPSYLAIERAVVECCLAGCDTIWIMCNDDVRPILKKRIGEVVKDPLYTYNNPTLADMKLIPVYYIKMDKRADEKQNCLSRSIIYGAESVSTVAGALSKWAKPERFYCSFVNSICLDDDIKNNRKTIKGPDNIYFTNNGRSIAKGDLINFTFNKKHLEIYRSRFLEIINDVTKISHTNLITVGQIFFPVDNEPHSELELSYQSDISSWDGYRQYMASNLSAMVKKNTGLFTRYKRKSFVRERGRHMPENQPQYKEG